MLGHILTVPVDIESSASDCIQRCSCGIDGLGDCVHTRGSSSLRTVTALGFYPRQMHWSGTCKGSRPVTYHPLTPVQLLRWETVVAFDIITEVIIFAMSFYLVHGLHMARENKLVVIGAFGFRLT